MILLRNYFISTTGEIDVKSVVHEVNRTVRESNAKEGLVTIAVPEPGAALTLIEMLPDVVAQLKEAVRIFPGQGMATKGPRKEDIDVGPRVAAAMLGRTLSIPLAEGRLVLGAREEPVLVDLEKGGRRREFCVQIMTETAQAQARPGMRPRR